MAHNVSSTYTYARVLYDYESCDRNVLTVRQGDLVRLIDRSKTGWWYVSLHGIHAWVPGNYCTTYDETDEYPNSRVATGSQHAGLNSAPSEENDTYVRGELPGVDDFQQNHDASQRSVVAPPVTATDRFNTPQENESLQTSFRGLKYTGGLERNAVDSRHVDQHHMQRTHQTNDSRFLQPKTSLGMISGGTIGTSTTMGVRETKVSIREVYNIEY